MANANLKTSSTEKTTYGDMILKKEIAPMLNLDPSGSWDIVSEQGSLIMVHHQPEADMNIYGALRGVVLDKNAKTVVCHSYPHAPKIVTGSLSVTNGRLLLGPDISCDPEKIKIKFGFEGPLIQVFKHDGKVYRCTRKRLDAGKSRWGNSKTFEEIYNELGGPADHVLFDANKKYSPYCHTFIMNHPDVLVCTKDNVGKGNLIYLSPKQMYSINKCPYPLEEVDTDLHVPDTVSSYNTDSEDKKIYAPVVLTLEEANKHLLFGFYEGFEGYQYLDARLLPGEFVILEDTENDMMYRIESPAYNWRSFMRNNNPNFLHRFFELLDSAYLKNTGDDEDKYRNMFPVLTFYDSESLTRTVKANPIVVWPQVTETLLPVPNTRDTKLYNIWQCFLVSVPLAKQAEIVTFYDYLVERRNETVKWISELSNKMSSLDMNKFSRRLQDILVKTRSFAADRIRRGENVDKKTREVKNIEVLTKENIRNFISKEMGSSLYRIIREMDRYNNPIV